MKVFRTGANSVDLWSNTSKDGSGDPVMLLLDRDGHPQIDIMTMPAVTANPTSYFRSDTFTGTGNGTTVDATAAPVSRFSILVRATGGTPTLWTLVLEASLDGTNFSTVLTHTNTLGLNVNVFSGSVFSAARYFRSRVVALTLGGATNIIADILGM